MEETIQQLRAELATENQEITYVIESQEQFMCYLEKVLEGRPDEEELIQGIIDEFAKIMI